MKDHFIGGGNQSKKNRK